MPLNELSRVYLEKGRLAYDLAAANATIADLRATIADLHATVAELRGGRARSTAFELVLMLARHEDWLSTARTPEDERIIRVRLSAVDMCQLES